MNKITFDVAPGSHPTVPAHRRWHIMVPDAKVMETLEALAMLNKSVLSVDTDAGI
jgi:hypothetical protein